MSNALAPSWLHEPADANVLLPSLWPIGTHRNSNGEMVIGGVAVSSLAETFGTPLYLQDEATVVDRARHLRDVFTQAFARHGRSVKLFYATKALLTADTLRLVSGEGYGADCSTLGELQWALRAGIPASSIEFLGNNKSDAELHLAVESGVSLIVVDSSQEVRRIQEVASRLGVVQDVAIRVNSGVHASTHDYLATAREDQKFGIARSDIEEVSKLLADSSALRLVGLHSHIGSQIFHVDGFVEAATRLLEVYATLAAHHPLHLLNMGGGFGVPYTSVDEPLDLAALANRLSDAVNETAAALGLTLPVVAFEPGRSIVATAGVTLYRVGTTKQVVVTDDATGAEHVRLYVSVDGGMSDNLRPALYGANYTPTLASRHSSAPPVLVRVVGKHCESGDIVVHDGYLPGDVGPGDLLAVAVTGAYCHSLASSYNQVSRPPIIRVANGEAVLSVRGETLEDLLSRDVGLGLFESVEETR